MDVTDKYTVIQANEFEEYLVVTNSKIVITKSLKDTKSRLHYFWDDENEKVQRFKYLHWIIVIITYANKLIQQQNKRYQIKPSSYINSHDHKNPSYPSPNAGKSLIKERIHWNYCLAASGRNRRTGIYVLRQLSHFVRCVG